MTYTGHIYKIICLVEPTFCYIGSTFNRLSKRFEKHRGHFNRWVKGEFKRKCACFPYFEKYGIENFKIILIKSYEVCRSHVKDRRHIGAYETLWINRHRGKCCNQVLPINYLKKEKKKEWTEKNKEKIFEKVKKYREENKEQIVEYKKEYYEKNKDKILEQTKKYREENKKKITERDKQKYEKNKDKIVEQQKKYREENKKKIAEKKKEKVECECGCAVIRDSLSRHKKTPKHKDLMAQK